MTRAVRYARPARSCGSYIVPARKTALIVTAGFDPLRDEGEAYAQKLRDAGVTVDYICYGGMIHGFAGMGKLLDAAQRAVALVGDSLRQALR